jgi:hypothetical protein
MVFGAIKGEHQYNKVKNGAKNSEGSKSSSGGGAARRGGEGRLPLASLHNDADAPPELLLGALGLVKQR